MPCSHAPSPFCPHSVSSLVSIPHPCPLSTCHPLLPAPSSHPSFTKSLQSPHSKFSSSFIPPDSNLLFQASLTHWELIQGFVVFLLSWAEGPGIYESWPSATAGMGVVKTDQEAEPGEGCWENASEGARVGMGNDSHQWHLLSPLKLILFHINPNYFSRQEPLSTRQPGLRCRPAQVITSLACASCQCPCTATCAPHAPASFPVPLGL